MVKMALVLLLLTPVQAGCGESTDNLTIPECGDGTIAYEAELDGSLSGGGASLNGYGFVNALSEDEPGTLELTSGNGVSVNVEFDTLVANGACVPARVLGFEDTPAGIELANCAPGRETPSRLCMDDDGNGGTLRIFELRASSADPCSAAQVDGEVAVCFRQMPF